MKNQRRGSMQRPTNTRSFSSRPRSFIQEKNGVIAGQGQPMSSSHDCEFVPERTKLETPWQTDAEIILPEQFFRAANQSFAIWTGERRLLFAVLEEAVESFLRYRNATARRGQRLFNETVEWFWDRDQEWLYSFEAICQHLGLNAEYIREGLQRLYEKETFASPARAEKKLRQTNRPLAHAA